MERPVQENEERASDPRIRSAPYVHFSLEIQRADIIRTDLLVDSATQDEHLLPKFYMMEESLARQALAMELAHRREQRSAVKQTKASAQHQP